jgi:hypothetical protein
MAEAIVHFIFLNLASPNMNRIQMIVAYRISLTELVKEEAESEAEFANKKANFE